MKFIPAQTNKKFFADKIKLSKEQLVKELAIAIDTIQMLSGNEPKRLQ